MATRAHHKLNGLIHWATSKQLRRPMAEGCCVLITHQRLILKSLNSGQLIVFFITTWVMIWEEQMRNKKKHLSWHTPSKRFRESLPFNELIHRPWQVTPVQFWRQFCNGLPAVIVHTIKQTKGRCFVVTKKQAAVFKYNNIVHSLAISQIHIRK